METTATKKESKKGYIEAVGRRKTSVARVRITEASKMSYVVNGKTLEEYLPTRELQAAVTDPFTQVEQPVKYSVSIVVNGGGMQSQAEAIRHGIARALVLADGELRKELKPFGFLKRDPRMKERRKFGLKKARKAPQWSKR